MEKNKKVKVALFSIIGFVSILATLACFSYLFVGPFYNSTYLKSINGFIESTDKFTCEYCEKTYDEVDYSLNKTFDDYPHTTTYVTEKDNSIREFLSSLKWETTTAFKEITKPCFGLREYNAILKNEHYTLSVANDVEKCKVLYVDLPYSVETFYKFSIENSRQLGKLILDMEQI